MYIKIPFLSMVEYSSPVETDHIFCIQIAVGGHRAGSRPLATMNNAALNSGVCGGGPCESLLLLLCGMYPEVGWLDLGVIPG